MKQRLDRLYFYIWIFKDKKLELNTAYFNSGQRENKYNLISPLFMATMYTVVEIKVFQK